ncbi:hypothetical protein GK047_17850 [Paenibacillus sp. SYP-B3998]|uniref:Uncharacterized protein n=1 Tax=Paenibacillus sp. SYP-B3998 TaxID=2678564 RepID=A0A6G4A2J0_9BACL|nr:hypothetical protein [Paenibacillus sp. SYP-B3998]NEW07867.1 hypothetical protein [Paenibacillus sp. SYP-B3998]
MVKWKIVSAVIVINGLLYTSAFANSASFTNLETANWDHPSSSEIVTSKVDKKLLSTKTTMKWTADKIGEFQSEDKYKQFFPALVYKVGKTDELRSKLMYTNLPGAKFTRKYAAYNQGEEVKLSILQTSNMKANKPYVFYTAWLNTSDGNPSVTLESLQGYSQPGGTLNEIVKTNDDISTIYFKDAEKINKKYQDFFLPDSFDSSFNQYQTDIKNKKVKSYSLINSKEKLDQYKNEATKELKFSNNEDVVQFAITFNKEAFSGNGLGVIEKDYDLTISQIYAAGIKENDKEEFTVSWFDANVNEMSLIGFQENLQQLGFEKFNITDLEGTAKVKDLVKMKSNLSYVNFIEIGKDGELPTGVHWLNELYDK